MWSKICVVNLVICRRLFRSEAVRSYIKSFRIWSCGDRFWLWSIAYVFACLHNILPPHRLPTTCMCETDEVISTILWAITFIRLGKNVLTVDVSHSAFVLNKHLFYRSNVFYYYILRELRIYHCITWGRGSHSPNPPSAPPGAYKRFALLFHNEAQLFSQSGEWSRIALQYLFRRIPAVHSASFDLLSPDRTPTAFPPLCRVFSNWPPFPCWTRKLLRTYCTIFSRTCHQQST